MSTVVTDVIRNRPERFARYRALILQGLALGHLKPLTSSPPFMEEIPAVSEIMGISDHLRGFLLRRGCPGEKAWFSPRSTPTMGSLTRFVPQPQTPPGLTTSPQALLPACPAVGLSTSKILSDGSGGIEPPRRRAPVFRVESTGGENCRDGLGAHCRLSLGRQIRTRERRGTSACILRVQI
jgi:hypothetical protein